MGFSLSWFAVRGKPLDRVVAELGWRKTGQQEEFPESATTCAELPLGWNCIVMQNRMDAADGTVDLASLSRGADVVACAVEEHVMFSSTVAWHDGEEVWSVQHDAQVGIGHLDVRGRPPTELAEFAAQAKAAQDAEDEGDAEVDYFFDVAVDIAQQVTGYRHDQDRIGELPLRFEVLEQSPRSRGQGWLRSLFRGGVG